MLVYLAGAIDNATFEEAHDWREQFVANVPANWVCFNPLGAFQYPSLFERQKENDEMISFINRYAISCCDILVANINGPVFGTIREIEFARACDKPVVVLVDDIRIGVEFHDLHQALTIEAAYEEIARVTKVR